MVNITYEIMRRKQQMYLKVYGILCLVLAISVGLYFFTKWQQYSGIRSVVAANRVFISELRNVASEEKSIYETSKDGFDTLGQEISAKLATIFPDKDDYTILTKQLDKYEAELSTKNNPFEVSIIDFQTPSKNDLFSILPVRLTIRSSAENFNKFLHLLESSGALSGQVRLMDVSSIRLSFQNAEVAAGTPEIINFTVQINAYFK